MSVQKPRTIRSFVRREGRLTLGQQRALDELSPRYGCVLPEGGAHIDLDTLFERDAPLTLEIGFGNGDSLQQQAAASPDENFLGIEVHRPGVGALMRVLEENDIQNLRVICEDANIVLQNALPESCVDTVQLFFPDPWPKKKHFKRRIVQADWLSLVASKLKPGGILHMATDWEHYAMHMLEVTDGHGQFENSNGAGNYAPRPDSRPLTKFEMRGQKLGHGVWDLIYRRK